MCFMRAKLSRFFSRKSTNYFASFYLILMFLFFYIGHIHPPKKTFFSIFRNHPPPPTGMLPKEYIVTTERLVTPEMVQSLVDGLELSDGPAKALEAELLQCTTERRTVAAAQMQRTGKMSRAERKRKAIEMEASATDGAGSVVVEKTTSVVRMVINMGRNHIVKRMFDHIGLSVTKLHRSAVGPSSLASLNLPEDGTEVKLSADTLRALWNARTVGTEVIASDEEVDDEN